jgi:hypothetical protein
MDVILYLFKCVGSIFDYSWFAGSEVASSWFVGSEVASAWFDSST